MKKCKKCNIGKDMDNFYKSGKYYMSNCKDCVKENRKEYVHLNYDKVRDVQKKSYKKWRENNREEYLNKQSIYRKENSEKIREYCKSYYQNKIDDIKEYRVINSKRIKEYMTEYYKNNKTEILHMNRERNNSRKLVDPLFKLSENIRTLLHNSIRRGGYSKNSKTIEILGCSFEEFKLYIESKFESWMTWENRGLYNGEFNYGWDLDHIIPVSSAKTEEEMIKLNHYTNFQPLCSRVNRDIKKSIIYEIY